MLAQERLPLSAALLADVFSGPTFGFPAGEGLAIARVQGFEDVGQLFKRLAIIYQLVADMDRKRETVVFDGDAVVFDQCLRKDFIVNTTVLPGWGIRAGLVVAGLKTFQIGPQVVDSKGMCGSHRVIPTGRQLIGILESPGGYTPKPS